ncbi:uncharacterized protein CANTADRAFT_191096 [Suhomyces tanzawaensis NRRL Y-17324]|uniref:Secreted protein n=1 Tax=Suhomyces tanzawaensis NRRL Y-17324 TaxID=984487 RepID=A0A1E4SNN9_9ASCO|nr:uncharacterized protein CANTADRAFT_191096 [Suhomyces tanzawaensis NRRL Y-17324]ODV81140.1 hypothetical protein CANTADRAFT_191096 [Suhomyces tanzawaensis NRRL Y-17324]
MPTWCKYSHVSLLILFHCRILCIADRDKPRPWPEIRTDRAIMASGDQRINPRAIPLGSLQPNHSCQVRLLVNSPEATCTRRSVAACLTARRAAVGPHGRLICQIAHHRKVGHVQCLLTPLDGGSFDADFTAITCRFERAGKIGVRLTVFRDLFLAKDNPVSHQTPELGLS